MPLPLTWSLLLIVIGIALLLAARSSRGLQPRRAVPKPPQWLENVFIWLGMISVVLGVVNGLFELYQNIRGAK
jgi:membrane-associated protease RseP (regulator of RpoE activity)